MGFLGGSSAPAPQIIQKPKVPAENDPSIRAALEKERLERLRRAGRASTMLSGDDNSSSGLKTELGQ
jgi:hypothetical protein